MGSNFKHRALIAMSLFKLDAEKNLQKTLDATKSIAARLITAKILLAEHHATAKQSARDNTDDARLDKAKNKNRAPQILIHTLSATLIDTDQQILELENDLTVAAHKKQREAAALEVEEIVEGVTSAAADVVTSLAALALQTESMARFLPDAAGLHSFAVRAKAELPSSIEMLTMQIRAYADAVLAGHAQATLPQVEAAAPPPRQWAFSAKPIKWTDAGGTVQTQHAFFEVQLPPVVAARALRKGACVGMDHELRKREHGFGSKKAKPDPADCIDLDSEVVAPDPPAGRADRRPDARSEVEGEQHRLVVTAPAAQRMEIRQAILPADHGLVMIRSDDALRRLAASTTVGKRSA
jgi:hypothetical protein